MLLESRIKRKREKAAIPQMRKFKLFFSFFKRRSFRANSLDLFRSSTSSFQCWRRRRRHCTASVKRHHFLYQPHMRAQFYTAAATDNALPPTPRRPLSLWIVHGEQFFMRKEVAFEFALNNIISKTTSISLSASQLHMCTRELCWVANTAAVNAPPTPSRPQTR